MYKAACRPLTPSYIALRTLHPLGFLSPPTMPSLRSVTALAALLSVTLASPVDLNSLSKRDTFSFKQVLRGTVKKNGPLQLAKAYSKYKGTAPSDVQSAAAAAVTGTVIATPEDEYDSLYLCPVTVGGTELQLDFDTVRTPSHCGEDLKTNNCFQGSADL